MSVFLFFDECAKLPRTCIKDCEENGKFPCGHRLHFPAQILGVDDYIRCMHFSDRQIILHCFHLIKSNDVMKIAAESGRFFIVTKDKNFLKDAQKNNKPSKRNHKTFPALGFGFNFVECDGSNIRILEVNCSFKADICGNPDDAYCAICRLNNLWHSGKI